MLFHTDIHMPEYLLEALPQELDLTYSRHALNAAKNDHKKDVSHFLPKRVKLATWRLVELEVENGTPSKIVIRKPIGLSKFDLVLVIKLDDSPTVKTVWANASDDTHTTLDKSRYTIVH